MYSMAFVYSPTADLVFSRISPTLEDILTVLNFLRAKMFASKAIFRVILNYIGFSPYRPTPESIPILLYLFDESFGSLFLLPCESVCLGSGPYKSGRSGNLTGKRCLPSFGHGLLLWLWDCSCFLHGSSWAKLISLRSRTPQSHRSYQLPIPYVLLF